MLFQMCYGPEIEMIYETVEQNPGQTIMQLRDKYQYKNEGDITSLVEGAVQILKDTGYIYQEDKKLFSTSIKWSITFILRKLTLISKVTCENEKNLDYAFASLYKQVFVLPNKVYENNIHYVMNSNLSDIAISQEKINAWKRIMECFGLGRRVYSGFYALPHHRLLEEIIAEYSPWQGSLQTFCEEKINPILPCITANDEVYEGMLLGLSALNNLGFLNLSNKQDFPHKSYGPHHDWNWIEINNNSKRRNEL